MKHAAALIVLATLVAVGCAHQPRGADRIAALESPELPTWFDAIAAWPESAQTAAREMGHKYGSPDEVTNTHLVWNNRGPWKRSILSREEIPHDWPTPHVDVLEQVIDFRVDPARVDELARFDGSVMVERSKGELSARCGGEAANFLAINLAQDIAKGKRTVEDARAFYEATVAQASAGEKPEYMAGLIHAVPSQESADRDRTAAKTAAAERKRAAAAEQSSKRASD